MLPQNLKSSTNFWLSKPEATGDKSLQTIDVELLHAYSKVWFRIGRSRKYDNIILSTPTNTKRFLRGNGHIMSIFAKKAVKLRAVAGHKPGTVLIVTCRMGGFFFLKF